MQSACKHADGMAATLQVRRVPEDVHRRLKARAALAGVSLSDYLLGELTRLALRPTPADMRERLERLGGLGTPAPVEDMIRGDRDAR